MGKGILVLGHHLAVPGTEKYWDEVAKTTEMDVELIVPASWKEGDILYRPQKKKTPSGVGIVPLYAPLSKYRKQNLYFFVNIFYILKRLLFSRPEIIYVINPINSVLVLQLSIIGRIFGIPVVAWSSRLEPRNFFQTFGWVKGVVFTLLRSVNGRLVKGVHATSEKAKEALRGEGFKGEIYVAPTHGIPEHYFKDSDRDYSPGGVIRVGYAGELKEFKGVQNVIAAIGGSENSRSFKLFIAGSGPYRSVLEKDSFEAGIEVEFLGFLPQDKMQEFYNKIDVFILPSLGDGPIIEKFGRVLIEAASCGCAVIGTRVGGIPLAVGESGLLYKYDDIDELRRILDSLIIRGNLLRHAENSQQFAVNHYSMSSVAGQFVNHVLRHGLDRNL